MLNSVRYMSSSNNPQPMISLLIKDAFLGFGDVVKARVITDRETGVCLGDLGLLNTPAMNLQSQHCP